ncbi:hypothetical protein AB0M57_13975 [Streptomyces sp. NPDC051597]|uniref:LexA family protein n=1 Tax=Streptomyces sp. NPDC051597 TaxID=3155049 RepID=UPI00341AD6C8
MPASANLPGPPPEIRADTNGPTTRQRAVLHCDGASVHNRGYSPSIHEIAEAVGLASTSSVSIRATRSRIRACCTKLPGAPGSRPDVQGPVAAPPAV